MKHLFFNLILVVILSSCNSNNKQEQKSAQDQLNAVAQRENDPEDPGAERVEISLHKIADLQENITLLDNIRSFTFVGEDHFVVSTGNMGDVLVYDMDGKQVLDINKQGRGPNEYINPGIVRSFNEHIYVWDAAQLKILIYDLAGNPIREYSGFSRAIEDFLPLQDRIVFYQAGGGQEEVIAFYDLEAQEYEKRLGEVKNEDLILGLSPCAGGLATLGTEILFAQPAELVVRHHDLSTGETEKTALSDSDFVVEKAEGGAEFINSQMNKAIEYLYGNSLVSGLFVTEDHVIMTAEVGKFDPTKESAAAAFAEKFLKLNVLDHNYTFKAGQKLPFSQGTNCLFASNGKDLFKLQIDEEEYHYILMKVNIN